VPEKGPGSFRGCLDRRWRAIGLDARVIPLTVSSRSVSEDTFAPP